MDSLTAAAEQAPNAARIAFRQVLMPRGRAMRKAPWEAAHRDVEITDLPRPERNSVHSDAPRKNRFT
jgi:hypothetical protein